MLIRPEIAGVAFLVVRFKTYERVRTIARTSSPFLFAQGRFLRPAISADHNKSVECADPHNQHVCHLLPCRAVPIFFERPFDVKVGFLMLSDVQG